MSSLDSLRVVLARGGQPWAFALNSGRYYGSNLLWRIRRAASLCGCFCRYLRPGTCAPPFNRLQASNHRRRDADLSQMRSRLMARSCVASYHRALPHLHDSEAYFHTQWRRSIAVVEEALSLRCVAHFLRILPEDLTNFRYDRALPRHPLRRKSTPVPDLVNDCY